MRRKTAGLYVKRLEEELASAEPLKLRLSREKAADIILALETGDDKLFYINIPNRGYISNLPEGAVVEVPALIGAHGVNALHVGALPPGIGGLVSAIVHEQELAVEAALSGSRQVALYALLADPLVGAILSIEGAERMLDEMLAAERRWLSQFF